MNLHNLPIYSWVEKLEAAWVFLNNFTGFEIGPCTSYIERARCKERIRETAKFVHSVLCHFPVAIKGKT